MNIQTSELSDNFLDYMVAKVEGFSFAGTMGNKVLVTSGEISFEYSPSINWRQGGPLVEYYKIEFIFKDTVIAHMHAAGNVIAKGIGSTPLIASMRCLVQSTFGTTVDIPDYLVKQLEYKVMYES